jgi:hypothetical protein
VITGAHAILFSRAAEADRELLRGLLGSHTVDAGGGWLILALPPAEIAVHPTDGESQVELYLMCDDVEATVADLNGRGIPTEGGITDAGWGLLTTIRLPSGASMGLYEPRHPVAAGGA